MMLGLRRGTVRLATYSPTWPALFHQEQRCLRQAIGALILDIQHIGSTSVPGLVAKPVLDIAVSVADLALVPGMVPEMEQLGYVYWGDQKGRGDHFWAKGSNEIETCFVHVVRYDDAAWRDFLRFRDYLRRCDKARCRYMEEKVRLASTYPHNRRAYTEAKATLIRNLLAETRDDLMLGQGPDLQNEALPPEAE